MFGDRTTRGLDPRTKEPPPGPCFRVPKPRPRLDRRLCARASCFPTHPPGEIVVSGRPLCDDRPRARLFVLFETPTLSRATEFTDYTTNDGMFMKGISMRNES